MNFIEKIFHNRGDSSRETSEPETVKSPTCRVGDRGYYIEYSMDKKVVLSFYRPIDANEWLLIPVITNSGVLLGEGVKISPEMNQDLEGVLLNSALLKQKKC